MTDIWLPGLGRVPFNIPSAQSAVTEYDPSLMLGRNEDTGDWVVLVKEGPHGEPFPVFNLGKELPGSEEIKRRLYMADVRRRGHKIVEDIERANDVVRQRNRDAAHDGAGEAAEAIEWGFRKMGRHPNPRIFVPSKED